MKKWGEHYYCSECGEIYFRVYDDNRGCCDKLRADSPRAADLLVSLSKWAHGVAIEKALKESGAMK